MTAENRPNFMTKVTGIAQDVKLLYQMVFDPKIDPLLSEDWKERLDASVSGPEKLAVSIRNTLNSMRRK